MSSDFDWQIDDDESDGPWQPGTQQRPPPERPPRRPRFAWLRHLPRWAWIAIAAAIVLAIGVPGGWLALRVYQLDQDQRAAVLNVAQLEDRLVAQGDVDAFAALQDPLFPGWQDWQSLSHSNPTLAVTDTYGSIMKWGSTALNEYVMLALPTYGAVHLDGESADLLVTRHYGSLGDKTSSQAFDLSTRQYYRFANGGWLHTAPPGDVYSRVRRGTGAALRVLYPEADRAIVEPYVPYLESIATRACRDFGCTDGPPALLISAVPHDLVQAESASPTERGDLYVPAPVLLGTPDTAPGQDALFRLYGIRLVEAIAARTTGATGTAAEPWLQWELAHLGLEAPMDATMLRDAARAGLLSGRAPILDPETRQAGIWLALDFLAGPSGKSPLRQLFAADDARAAPDQLAQQLRDRNWNWWAYLQQVAALEPQYPTSAELAVACDRQGTNQAALWDAATGALRPLGTGADFLLWSADGRRLIGHSWRNGFTVYDMALGPLHGNPDTPLAWAPDDEWVAVYSDQSDTRYLWRLGAGQRIDLANGPGWAGWSPDGQHLAYLMNDAEVYLALPDASQPRLLAAGNRAVWSPDSRYLAIGSTKRSSAPVLVYDLLTAQATTVVSATGGILYDLAWAPSPAPPQLAVSIYNAVTPPQASAGTVLDVSPQGGLLHRWAAAGAPFDVEWSPDGLSLGWAMMPNAGGDNEIWIAQIAGESARRLAAPGSLGYILSWHWSPAGDWLAVDHGRVTVLSTGGAQARQLPDGCRAPAWRPQADGEGATGQPAG